MFPRALAVVDVDADGLLDCVTANFLSHNLSILSGAVGSGDPLFRRGDTNLDARVELTDVLTTLNALFVAGPPLRCPDAADTNDDGRIQIADVVSLLNYLFAGGAAPAAPGPDDCGEDPSADALPGCEGLCR